MPEGRRFASRRNRSPPPSSSARNGGRGGGGGGGGGGYREQAKWEGGKREGVVTVSEERGNGEVGQKVSDGGDGGGRKRATRECER